MQALILVLPALAAETVLYDGGDVAAAQKAVSRAANVPESALAPVAVESLFTDPNPVAVGTRLDKCAQAPTSPDAFKQSLDSIEGAVSYVELDRARTELDSSLKAMVCVNAPLDGATVARFYYLRGIVAANAGDQRAASAAFRQAHIFHPSMGWDDDFPPDSKDLFEASIPDPSEGTVTVRLVPAPPMSALVVDGQTIPGGTTELALPPGDHLFQVIGGPTVRLTLAAGESPALVVPGFVTNDVLLWASQPARHGDLAVLSDAALPEGVRYYLYDGDEVYRGEAGRKNISLAADSASGGGGRGLSLGLFGAGALAGAGGGVLLAKGMQDYRAWQVDSDSFYEVNPEATEEDWEQANQAAIDGYTPYYRGAAVMFGVAGASILGGVLLDAPIVVGPTGVGVFLEF